MICGQGFTGTKVEGGGVVADPSESKVGRGGGQWRSGVPLFFDCNKVIRGFEDAASGTQTDGGEGLNLSGVFSKGFLCLPFCL